MDSCLFGSERPPSPDSARRGKVSAGRRLAAAPPPGAEPPAPSTCQPGPWRKPSPSPEAPEPRASAHRARHRLQAPFGPSAPENFRGPSAGRALGSA